MQKALTVTPGDIEDASERITDFVLRTPLVKSTRLSNITGADIQLKYENMQATGSFKERGALNKLLSLTEDEHPEGVIAMSAGNHAQAVAHHAARLGIPATIVMPETTPFVKVGNTEALGANVLLAGETLAEAREMACELSGRDGLDMIHPYDDPLVIAGQGTIGLEILADQPDIDCLVVPVGGGGLISGIAIATKAVKPDVEIIGVEVASYPSLYAALCKKEMPCGGMTLADGIAVKTIGEHTLPIVRSMVDDLILVSEEQIEQAVFALASRQKTVVEGAGAAGLAAIMDNRDRFKDRKVGIVLSGGNIDPRILAAILVRGLERDGRIVSLRLTIFDQPGTLGRIASLLGDAGANILSISHRRILLDVPPRGSSLDMMIETKDARHSDTVIQKLKQAGYDVVQLKGTAAADFMTN